MFTLLPGLEAEWEILFGTSLPQMVCQCLPQEEILIRFECRGGRSVEIFNYLNKQEIIITTL